MQLNAKEVNSVHPAFWFQQCTVLAICKGQQNRKSSRCHLECISHNRQQSICSCAASTCFIAYCPFSSCLWDVLPAEVVLTFLTDKILSI